MTFRMTLATMVVAVAAIGCESDPCAKEGATDRNRWSSRIRRFQQSQGFRAVDDGAELLRVTSQAENAGSIPVTRSKGYGLRVVDRHVNTVNFPSATYR